MGNKYDVEKLRRAVGLDEDDIDTIETDTGDRPDATHECSVCRFYMTHIESSPTSDYNWCPECEDVTRFVRIR